MPKKKPNLYADFLNVQSSGEKDIYKKDVAKALPALRKFINDMPNEQLLTYFQ